MGLSAIGHNQHSKPTGRIRKFTGIAVGSAPQVSKWEGKVGEEGGSLIYDKPEQELLQHQDKPQH
jgi:hypothetical protein